MNKHTAQIKCANCGAKPNMTWVKAMQKAGFSLRHLECKQCGQQTLKLAGEDD